MSKKDNGKILILRRVNFNKAAVVSDARVDFTENPVLANKLSADVSYLASIIIS